MLDIDEITTQKLLGSLLLFTRVFYKLRTGREFVISRPICRESHCITVPRTLTLVFKGKILRLRIQLPPRYGKTELAIHFIAWALAHYPDANCMYISYSHSLAKKQTQTIKEIITLPDYRKLFNVHIKEDVAAKDNFETTANGSVYAVGAGGTVTGRGAGIQNINRFGGLIIIDDIHKPSEVTSDTIRTGTNEWYLNTLQSRVNSPTTPIVYIGQALHEDDLGANLDKGIDGHKWEVLSIPALDVAKNALNPAMHTKEQLLLMQEKMPYEFAAQYQQNPQPAGGGIFKTDWFVLLDEEPEFLKTFITIDTAETDKTYNDATAFSFWGIYKLKVRDIEMPILALHWIDCCELWVEPKDLEAEFDQFYFECLQHKTKPSIVTIEKKSTGVTLSSILKTRQGIQIINVDRTKASGSKAARYLEMQPYVASRRISLPTNAKHTDFCIEHMRKITANDSHRHDDIADTAYDAVKRALIDEAIYIESEPETNEFLRSLNRRVRDRKRVRGKAYGPQIEN